MATYSVFDVDTSVTTLEAILAAIREMGYDVVRTKSVGGPEYPDGRERGFQIVGTDVTLGDPKVMVGHGPHPVIRVFCPSRTLFMMSLPEATHDPDLNKEIYNRLKRKFTRKKK